MFQAGVFDPSNPRRPIKLVGLPVTDDSLPWLSDRVRAANATLAASRTATRLLAVFPVPSSYASRSDARRAQEA